MLIKDAHMPAITEPKLISGNANRPLATAIARRMSMHRGMSVGLVDARVDRQPSIYLEVWPLPGVSELAVDTALRERLDDMLAREGRAELAQACFDFLPTRAKLDLGNWTEPDVFAH